MNQLMFFEKVEVSVSIIDNEPMFELYSTGMALGQVKRAKGINYPRKDRIDENVRNAEIEPVVRNGQRWINESQLYELMLEVKTEKVRPFRKWITHEVLPSIRKTGKYEMRHYTQKQIEAPYTYTDKYFNGQQVVTLRDIEYFTGIPAATIGYCIRHHHFIQGVDFYLLEDMQLREFKNQNPCINKLVGSLNIVTKIGCMKLARIMKGMKELTCFKELEPPKQKRTKEFTPVPEDKTLQKLIKEAQEDMTALNVFIRKFNAYNSVKEYKFYQKTMRNIFETLHQKVSVFMSMEVGA